MSVRMTVEGTTSSRAAVEQISTLCCAQMSNTDLRPRSARSQGSIR